MSATDHGRGRGMDTPQTQLKDTTGHPWTIEFDQKGNRVGIYDGASKEEAMQLITVPTEVLYAALDFSQENQK